MTALMEPEVTWMDRQKYPGKSCLDIARHWKDCAFRAHGQGKTILARQALERARFWRSQAQAEAQAIRLILKRGTARGQVVDILECGHVLPVRLVLRPNQPMGSRRCSKCVVGAPPDLPRVLALTHEERMAIHWPWWYSMRGPEVKPIPPILPEWAR